MKQEEAYITEITLESTRGCVHSRAGSEINAEPTKLTQLLSLLITFQYWLSEQLIALLFLVKSYFILSFHAEIISFHLINGNQ